MSRLPASTCAWADRLAAAARDDLDHAADRVGAVERALRSAHHFDALDVLQRHLRQIEAAAKRVGADAVDQDERVSRIRRRA